VEKHVPVNSVAFCC